MAEIDYSKQKVVPILDVFKKGRDDREESPYDAEMRETLQLLATSQLQQQRKEAERTKKETEYYQRKKILQEDARMLQEQENAQMAKFEKLLWKMTENDPKLREELFRDNIKVTVQKPENLISHSTVDIDIFKDGKIKVSEREATENVRMVIKQK